MRAVLGRALQEADPLQVAECTVFAAVYLMSVRSSSGRGAVARSLLRFMGRLSRRVYVSPSLRVRKPIGTK
jgi:hypothetical protein